MRAVVRVWDDKVVLASRLGNDVTAGYPELAALGPALGERAAVPDGEIVAFDDRGRPSFERLQRRMHVRGPNRLLMAEVPVFYVVFDVLWLDGEPLTGEPFVERHRRLEALGLKGPNWTVSNLLPEPPDDDLLAACRQGRPGGLPGQAGLRDLPGQQALEGLDEDQVRPPAGVRRGWLERGVGRPLRPDRLPRRRLGRPRRARGAGPPLCPPIRRAGRIGPQRVPPPSPQLSVRGPVLRSEPLRPSAAFPRPVSTSCAPAWSSRSCSTR